MTAVYATRLRRWYVMNIAPTPPIRQIVPMIQKTIPPTMRKMIPATTSPSPTRLTAMDARFVVVAPVPANVERKRVLGVSVAT